MISKDTITQVYHDLVIDKKTTKITVKEICQQCHISRTTFYKYFKDAYDILEYIFVNDAMEPLKNLIEETSLDSKLITVNWYLTKDSENSPVLYRWEMNRFFHMITVFLLKIGIICYNIYATNIKRIELSTH